MFALLGQAGRLGLRAKRARRGDQASAARIRLTIRQQTRVLERWPIDVAAANARRT
jgi:hypothetical protein